MVIGISGSESVGSPWSFARMRCLPVMPQYHHRLTKLGNVINRPVMERECRSSSDLRNCGCDECGLTDGGGKRVEQHICDGSRHASAHLTLRPSGDISSKRSGRPITSPITLTCSFWVRD